MASAAEKLDPVCNPFSPDGFAREGEHAREPADDDDALALQPERVERGVDRPALEELLAE